MTDTPRATAVLAPNPGPLTLDGTNTYLVAEPGADVAVVVDPGPDDSPHLDALVATATSRGLRIASILLTHGHPDHAAGAVSLAERTRAPVRALDPRHTLGAEGLVDGDLVEMAGLELRVLATPGHSADHLCFVLPADAAVLTGDHVLGRGTSVVAHPDGNMRDYLDSLRRLADVGTTTLLPGHGPRVDDAAERIAYYVEHRAQRERQIVAALEAGAQTPAEIVAVVYADVDRALHPTAEMSVRAHLDLLSETHRVQRDAGHYRLVS
ncbi:MAG: MBL fold metallo-hydrolase [Mycobacteriales bacterium]|nr:MBL fold metallo-hydrolase [Frankia sp.]